MSTIAINLAFLRKRRSMSQERLADELEITRARLSSWEENRAEPPVKLLIKIAEYFGVSLDEFLKQNLTKNAAFSKNRYQNHQG